MCSLPVLRRICRESYSDPLELYEALKCRGMDLVTVTDHDSIGAAESLRRFPDFFLSEEVTCTTPSGTELHAGVYGITESDHVEIQRRRTDLPSLIAYLNENNILFSINHVFSRLTGARTDADFQLITRKFPAVETRNGQLLEACNRPAADFAERWGKAIVAGSDAHTLDGVGKTYTEVPMARNASEFLDGLRRASGRAMGESGSFPKLTRAIVGVAWDMCGEVPWTFALTPLFTAIPAVTLMSQTIDLFFSRKWSRRQRGARTPACSVGTHADASSMAVKY